MALALGNLLGAVANVTTAVQYEKSYKSFLTNIGDFGVQVKNMFEVNFSGLDAVTFRIQEISLPTMKVNTTELYYNGRSVLVPINYDYEHNFSMSILNDAKGYIYPAISEFIMLNATTQLANGGYTMTLKALTGDDNYDGALITCTGVVLTGIDGLSFGQSLNDVQIFNVLGLMLEYTVTPGVMSTAASVFGAANSLLG